MVSRRNPISPTAFLPAPSPRRAARALSLGTGWVQGGPALAEADKVLQPLSSPTNVFKCHWNTSPIHYLHQEKMRHLPFVSHCLHEKVSALMLGEPRAELPQSSSQEGVLQANHRAGRRKSTCEPSSSSLETSAVRDSHVEEQPCGDKVLGTATGSVRALLPRQQHGAGLQPRKG